MAKYFGGINSWPNISPLQLVWEKHLEEIGLATVAKYFGGNISWPNISLLLLVWKECFEELALPQWPNILVEIFLSYFWFGVAF